MDNFRAKKEKNSEACDMQKKKTDSGRHIRRYKQKVSGRKHRSALIMRTTCPVRAQTLGDLGTMIPILEVHLEIIHAIPGNIQLS